MKNNQINKYLCKLRIKVMNSKINMLQIFASASVLILLFKRDGEGRGVKLTFLIVAIYEINGVRFSKTMFKYTLQNQISFL